MKFRFVVVGALKDPNWKALCGEYLERLGHFVRCETVELRDAPGPDRLVIEGKRILEKLNPNSLVCLLDVDGKSITSHHLAATIEKWQNTGVREVAFVIGGPEGVGSAVAERADVRLSLSFLTFTHEMARVVLTEQLYRAFTIVKGFPYQK